MGVGARNIQECLLLKLEPEVPDYYFQKELIEKHLLDIGKNRYPKIVRETGKNLEAIKKAVDEVIEYNSPMNIQFKVQLNNKTKWISARFTPINSTDSIDPISILIIASDISERKKTLTQLKKLLNI